MTDKLQKVKDNLDRVIDDFDSVSNEENFPKEHVNALKSWLKIAKKGLDELQRRSN